jgi:serine/threonine protein kinase/tetratricopeptide (TPR) repeat protein
MARASGTPPKDWEEIDRIFTQALDLAPERWPAFLDEACEGDPELRSRVADLLRLSLTLDDFLKEPRLEVEGELAADLADRLGDRDAPFPTEARIGPYRIVDTLGRGGAGTVYLAERVEGGRKPPVALKVLRRGLDTDDLLERFTVERQILATLDHPDVARLLDAGATDDGRPYLVMEHVDGEPITEHCRARSLSVQERLGLFVRVARAVHHAHGSLIVHRDLKPTNVLVAEGGAPKLLDFGIAKLLDPDALAGKGPQTRTGTRLLTPGYASPEQRRGEPVTPASDIYQLGLLLYELLTGVAAYEAAGKEGKEAEEGDEGGEEKRRAYRDQWGDGDRPLPRIPAPSKVARRTGGTGQGKEAGEDADPAREAPPDTGSTTQRRRRRDLDRIVMTALEEEPGDRYPTAAALAADVERVLQGQRPQGVAHLPMGLVARKLARRLGTRRRKAAAAALALGAVAGILAVASVSSRGPGDGEPPAADPGDAMFHLVPPPWVVVAEFDAPADQPELGWAVRELVMESLAGTEGATPIPREELQRALRMADLPDTTRVDEFLARELAARAGLSAALSGSVSRLGAGYVFRAQATDPQDGRVLVSVVEQAEDRDRLMAGMEGFALRLASQLEEHLETMAPTRPATLLTTSSHQAFEHYRGYLQAQREERPPEELQAQLRRVLDLDPDFAMAWRAVAILHHDQSRPDSSKWAMDFAMAWPQLDTQELKRAQSDSARLALDRAMGLRGRITETERLHIEAVDAGFRGEYDAQIDIYGRILAINPRDETAHLERSHLLQHYGRYEEALRHHDALDALLSDESGTKGVTGRFLTLLSLGRLQEARALRSRLPEDIWRKGEMLMALGAGEWAVAESLAVAIRDDPEGLGQRVGGWRWTIASAQAARGAVRAADSTLLAIPSWFNGRVRLVLALSTGCDLAAGRALPLPDDTTAHRLQWNAVIATVMRDQDSGLPLEWETMAHRRTQDPSNRPHLGRLRTGLWLARNFSWAAVLGDSDQRPAQARQGVHDDYGTTALRWLVAHAYERSGQLDSAAVYFHMAADSASFFWEEHALRGFAYPFAQRRLAFLYARLGETERAEHHWDVFRKTFTDPDPELLWLLDESPLEGTLPGERYGDGALAGGGLFSDADRACGSIEAGRRASFEMALASKARLFERHLARHGQYPTGGSPRSWFGEWRGGQLFSLTESDGFGWVATAIDLRDTRVCRGSGGDGPLAKEGYAEGDVVCVRRPPADAYRQDRATLVIQGALSELNWELRTAWQSRASFPPELPGRDGVYTRPSPGQLFRSSLFPEARVEIIEADARELRALGTHPESQARCTLSVNSALSFSVSC